MLRSLILPIVLVSGFINTNYIQAQTATARNTKITATPRLRSEIYNRVSGRVSGLQNQLRETNDPQEILPLTQLENMKTAYEEASNVSEKSGAALSAFMKTTLDKNSDAPATEQAQALVYGFAELTDSMSFLNTGTGKVTLADFQGHGGLMASSAFILNFEEGESVKGDEYVKSNLDLQAVFTQVTYSQLDGDRLIEVLDTNKSRDALAEAGAVPFQLGEITPAKFANIRIRLHAQDQAFDNTKSSQLPTNSESSQMPPSRSGTSAKPLSHFSVQ
jgi:hypothetical protein